MKAARSRKTATNLSVRADLVRRARELELNLSEVLETALTRAIEEAERQRWLAENEAAIDAYNAGLAKRALFGDEWRRF